MRKTKEQKAITLIALIITIVVLLILAAVAIASITNDGVLSYAENATTQYNQAVKNEQDTLQGYVDYLNKHNGGSTGGTGSGEGSGSEGTETIGTATVGTKVDKNSTINGEAYSSTNPIIPAGFKAINTDTAKWDEGILADNVKNGLVISDEAGNEFVWIPVANINEMAKVTSGVDANGRTNYEGKLYNFYDYDSDEDRYYYYDAAQEMENYGYGTTNIKEPANLTGNDDWGDYRDKADRFTTITWHENFYQESFNKMVESVVKYKGFYVGRYEMSLDASGKAQSKAEEIPELSIDWWGFYEKTLTYSNSGVVSEMIWGCQWDAMMIWMQGNNIDVTSQTPIDTARGEKASRSNDILNNVYGLIGNKREWTQEKIGSEYRIFRGGLFGYDYYHLGFPSYRTSYPSTSIKSDNGSRLTLYVEV